MSRHIIRPFHSVQIGGIAIRHELTHKVFEVAEHIRIGIFADQQ